MSIRATVTCGISVTETFEGPFVNPGDATATFDQLSESVTLDANSTPPASKHASYEKALSSGTGTIDLTALPGVTAEETVNGTGLKVQQLKFRNKSTNANKITVAKGASNGYGLCASGDSWSFVLSPNQSITFYGDDAAPDIGSGAKTIDLTGTGSQVLEVAIVMG